MEIIPAVGDAEKLRTELLVVGVFSGGPLTRSARRLDRRAAGRLSVILKRGELDEAPGTTLLIHHLPGSVAARILLVSLGKRALFSDRAYCRALAATAKVIAGSVASEAVVTLAESEVPGRSLNWRVQQAAQVLTDGGYAFVLPETQPCGSKARARARRSIMLLVPQTLTSELVGALRRGVAIAEGVALAKDLGNLPGNICTPAYLAETAREMGEEFGFEVEILERQDLEALGMGAFLVVGRSSANPCKLIVLKSNGGGIGSRPVVLVGKGITFDIGGTPLTPGADPDEMKFNMSGAGSVLGVMRTIARLAVPINVVGLIAAAESMPVGSASRPGDVVTSMSGQTIEIRTHEAEGRLLLCDVLTYAERFAPACVIDVATLTEACVVALGSHASGLFANDDALAAELLRCGSVSGDRVWQLPIWDDYVGQLGSSFADTSNLGGRAAGAITAACFLARFATAYPWAHLDIAGTASISGAAKASTGRPVPLLAEFLISRAAESAPALSRPLSQPPTMELNS
ncbi:leucyl aminopeptidase [Bosea caraganae]|uniref:Probable cytosol aminopeptidase n=1 Tax=Bosea caraganae TaxID=2763117 RepID=A0A370L4X5_9HYPH|nr:leucyl aminopeptidase [Bosea caraganae]RDJ24048.1 leucyl aminopeptidase [Bosea caraganae]RDJ30090.1 leucyl aminopeptidase [Bosea caraganae]